MVGGPRRETLALRDTGDGEEGEVTVQVYNPAVRLESLKLREEPRPTGSLGAELRVQVYEATGFESAWHSSFTRSPASPVTSWGVLTKTGASEERWNQLK